MSALQNWLRGEVTSGRLHRRRPFRQWQVRHGHNPNGSPHYTAKRLWAYSDTHRWVWNYCQQYEVCEELSTDVNEIRRRLGRTSSGSRLLRETDVASLVASGRDFNRRVRYYLLQGRRPSEARRFAEGQLTTEARLIMTAAALGGVSSCAGPTYGPGRI